ncbi:hypothetical protein J2S43_003442 [Catenuloplanes nepalensis]|uniref:Transposase n=1 Tax=Catenuloplanes nepalensis TaxID=587533 RepID=A0ABT9MU10_9ACTN|nr:hypothetical protein [Catenuloplanes nepalensis]MDP9794930.1 hypothetical protein [Catenuloplanes nepalensis]
MGQAIIGVDPHERVLGTVRPRDLVGRTRRWLASELIHELVTIDRKIKVASRSRVANRCYPALLTTICDT